MLDSDIATASENKLLAALAPFAQWVCYRSKDDKAPRKTNGELASIADPATWATYEAASAAIGTNGIQGIGFVLSDRDPFTCVDIDDKEGNGLSEFQQTVLNGANDNTYIEKSPSGRGFHVWVRGSVDCRQLPPCQHWNAKAVIPHGLSQSRFQQGWFPWSKCGEHQGLWRGILRELAPSFDHRPDLLRNRNTFVDARIRTSTFPF